MSSASSAPNRPLCIDFSILISLTRSRRVDLSESTTLNRPLYFDLTLARSLCIDDSESIAQRTPSWQESFLDKFDDYRLYFAIAAFGFLLCMMAVLPIDRPAIRGLCVAMFTMLCGCILFFVGSAAPTLSVK